mgnify:CR=1 FL=1
MFKRKLPNSKDNEILHLSRAYWLRASTMGMRAILMRMVICLGGCGILYNVQTLPAILAASRSPRVISSPGQQSVGKSASTDRGTFEPAATVADVTTSIEATDRSKRAKRAAAAGSQCAPNRVAEGRPLNWVHPHGDDLRACMDTEASEMCATVRAAAIGRQVLLVLVEGSSSDDSEGDLSTFLTAAAQVGVTDQVLLAALDDAGYAAAIRVSGKLPCGGVLPPSLLPEIEGSRATRRLEAKYRLAAMAVSFGVGVMVADVGVLFRRDPFTFLWEDSDFEVPGPDSGRMSPAMDVKMGWSQMCETYISGRLAPSLVYAAATHEARALLRRMAARVALGEVSMLNEAHALTEELLAPAHDGVTRAGATLRVMHPQCAEEKGGRGRAAEGFVCSVPPPRHSEATLQQSKILESRAFYGKVQVLAEGCVATPKVAPNEMDTPWVASHAMPPPRPLNLLAPKGSEWPIAAACSTGGLPALCDTLKRVAINREVRPRSNARAVAVHGRWGTLLCSCGAQHWRPCARNARAPSAPGAARTQRGAHQHMSTSACVRARAHASHVTCTRTHAQVMAAVWKNTPYTMLDLYMRAVKRAGISNSLIVALDEPTAAYLKSKGEAHYQRPLEAKGGGRDNHATSGLKFKILVDFLSVGCSVLLSDVDVLWLSNPFPQGLYRDSDVEGMSDGWDHLTAYGHDVGGGSLRVHARNSGMFYLQATREGLAMVRRLAYRMDHEGTWDQSAFNQEQVRPSMGQQRAVGVSTRVMPYLCNLNSKLFFRFLREDKELLHGYTPLSLHINYHPEKLQRMDSVYGFYAQGVEDGIWKWNGGEGSKLMSECQEAVVRAGRPDASKPHIGRIIASGVIDWGGCLGCLKPQASGVLGTPWGQSSWGEAGITSVYPGFEEAVFAKVGGALHLLRFNSTGEFLSTRCSDGELLTGKLG